MGREWRPDHDRASEALQPGKPAATDRHGLPSLTHSFTLDWLLGFVGPKEEAEEIKGRLGLFLREILKLELSPEKTLITHATTGAARFLGYEIVTHQADEKRDQAGHRTLNGHIGLRMPNEVVERKRAQYLRAGKANPRPELLFNED